MIFLIISILILFLILIVFASPKFSPIPYFPTNKKDLPLIIKALGLKNNQLVLDLGAGDGAVIFAAAETAMQEKLNTTFIAVEINPVLILILHIRRFFNPNKQNIKIIWGDLFKEQFAIRNPQFNNVTIYVYVSPWLLEKIINHIAAQFPHFSIVSYMYPIKSLKSKEKTLRGKNYIYSYQINLGG